ncbi:histidine phosphatase family protein [Roseixanthobacter pseudopolyaromaticivorans]|uniref:histidine phosphatase family protein n=1 Tax=Xanthobacteraceae TaxID=335928 RepID=UPI0037281784
MAAFCFSRLAFRSLLTFALAGAGFFATLPASAAPARIIILRHGEKQDAYRLCRVGNQRAQALAAQYLGKGAANSLFPAGEAPAAIIAVTLHTMELAAPAAATWALPVVMYTALPEARTNPRKKQDRAVSAPPAPAPAAAAPPAADASAEAKPKKARNPAKVARKSEFTQIVTTRTRQAVNDVMSDPRFTGKTVVMVWEHDHIADADLEAANPGQDVTLRQLLHLGALPDVPASWPWATYDYFWIVDFGADGKPTRFTMQRQVFDGAFSNLPSNEWGAPNGMTAQTGCVL